MRFRALLFLLICFALPALAQREGAPPASQAEVNAGALTSKFVSPATLAGWTGGGSSITAATVTNISGAVVTNLGAMLSLTPYQFLAKGDGVTDDTLAVSNMIYVLNSSTLIRRIDFSGGKFLVTSVPIITRSHVDIDGGGSGYLVISNDNACPLRFQPENPIQALRVENLFVFRYGTNYPAGTNCAGVWFDSHGSGGVQNVLVSHCNIKNFADDVRLQAVVQGKVEFCNLHHYWTNGVYAGKNNFGSDAIHVIANDLNERDAFNDGFGMYTGTLPLAICQQTVAINDGGGNRLVCSGNQGGGCFQAYHVADVGSVEISGNNWEDMWNASTNTVPAYFTNCSVKMDLEFNICSFVGCFSSSNYLAQIGLYGCNLKQSHFSGYAISTFDVWGYTGYQGKACQVQCDIAPTIRQHTVFGDAGTVRVWPYPTDGNVNEHTSTETFLSSRFYVGADGVGDTAGTVTANTVKNFEWRTPSWSASSIGNMAVLGYNAWGNGSADFSIGANGFDSSPGATAVLLLASPDTGSAPVRELEVRTSGITANTPITGSAGVKITSQARYFTMGADANADTLTANNTHDFYLYVPSYTANSLVDPPTTCQSVIHAQAWSSGNMDINIGGDGIHGGDIVRIRRNIQNQQVSGTDNAGDYISEGYYLRMGNLGSVIRVGYFTNGVPNLLNYPNGSLVTTTNGQIFVRSNAAWVLH